MKLNARDAAAWIAGPPKDGPGGLIYGQDPMRVALKREELIDRLLGPGGAEEMRLTRMTGAQARKEPTMVIDALKAIGFFPGPRVVFVEEANDAVLAVLQNALDQWRPGDAQLIVTAGALSPRAKLRKFFEAHPTAKCAAIYDNPPSRAEIEATLAHAGLSAPQGDAMAALTGLAQSVDPGDFRQIVEKIALYKLSDPGPVSCDDVAAAAPLSVEADNDELIAALAEAQANAIGPLLARLGAQGANAVSLCLSAQRHFRMLHQAASDPSGVSSGIAKIRPPLFGPRRDAISRQATRWGVFRSEQALAILVDTDLVLRSSSRAPQMALVERAFIRLAMLGAR